MTTPHRLLLFASLALGAALAAGPVRARADEPSSLARAEADLVLLAGQLRDPRVPSADLLGSVEAIEAEFFRLAAAPPPGVAAAVTADPALAPVKAWQGRALDLLLRALTVARPDARHRGNRLADVNLRAAVALGILLGSPELAVHRDAKELARLRADRARALEDALEGPLGKPKPGRDPVSAALLEATFAALARTNDPAALDWLREEYLHTRSGELEEQRLLAAHKAMLLFTHVPGRARHALARQVIVSYRGTAASAAQNPPVNKPFWDRLKFGIVELFKHYATPPGGGPPANARGEVLNTLEELHVWWRRHDDPTKAPWLDPKPAG